ncbi:cupin domain-containing protein [Peribacillus butanolivorans]|uniref:hypothetical protein n=1 Tax=Peribacillus butanolivorans TaxID=421767 RepID=UPI00167F3AAE|nr:hypothetical protein [Peribacillus butanolivorans]QNU04778.1 hypothetical protein GM240_13090 [Peribacillus butanolivorans]
MEHRRSHPARSGMVYLYVEGKGRISTTLPAKHAEYYTAQREIILYPGEQYTIPTDTNHWFKAGPEGAIISEFSSNSDDSSDIFTNPNIVR